MGDQTIHMSDKLRKRKEWWRQQKGERKRVRKKTLFNGSRYYRIKIFIYRFIYGFLSPQQTNCCHQNLRNGLLDSIRIIWLEDGCGENSVLGHENLQGGLLRISHPHLSLHFYRSVVTELASKSVLAVFFLFLLSGFGFLLISSTFLSCFEHFSRYPFSYCYHCCDFYYVFLSFVGKFERIIKNLFFFLDK